MSFGFGVGDFLAVYQQANKVRKKFAGAPSQFKTIADEVRNPSIILSDSECVYESRESASPHPDDEDLRYITANCQSVLDELTETIDKYCELKSVDGKTDTKDKFKRAWKRLTFEPEDIRELRSRICSNIAALNAYNTRIARDNTQKLLQHQEEQQHESILAWLTKPDLGFQQVDYGSQHSLNLSRRQQGTGRWFLDSVQYRSWLDGDKQTLLCLGIPGAGKTTIAAIVIDDIHKRIEASPAIGLAFVYCGFRAKQNLSQLLASLVAQLSHGSDLKSLTNLYERHKFRRTRPTTEELSTTLVDIVISYAKVFFVIDAIDECSTDNGTRTRLLATILNIKENHNVNLMATSRHIPAVERLFKDVDCTDLEIRAKGEDIDAYVDAQISDLPYFVLEDVSLMQDIKNSIKRSVAGMFMLAAFYLDSLKGKMNSRGIRDALKRFPVGSDDLMYDFAYENAMERIQGQLKDHVDLAMKVLSWVSSAEEPMETSAIIDALAVEPGDQYIDKDRLFRLADLESVCAGLVTVDQSTGIIRLVHYTAQEYFDRKRNFWFPTADLDITRSCLTYLSFMDFGTNVHDLNDDWLRSHHPFGFYAFVSWGFHARRASKNNQKDSSQPLRDLLMNSIAQFFDTPNSELVGHLLLARVFEDDEETLVSQSSSTSSIWLHTAVFHELEDSIKFRGNYDVNAKDSLGRTPLHCAVGDKGGGSIIRLLLSAEDIDVNAQDYLGRSALWWAVFWTDSFSVKLLVQHEGIDVNLRDDEENLTPLQVAVENGDGECLKLLLETGKVDVNAPHEYGSHILDFPIDEGNEEITKLLVEHGAEIPASLRCLLEPSSLEVMNDTRDSLIKTLVSFCVGLDDRSKVDQLKTHLLSKAITTENHRAMELLFANGADVNSGRRSPEDSLHLGKIVTSNKRYLENLLFDRGAGIIRESTRFLEETPLLRAISKQDEHAVRLLLTWHADVNVKGGLGNDSPLLLAIKKASPISLVELLLENGADVEGEGCHAGESPLLYAVICRQQTVCKLLLEKGAKVDRESGTPMETPLHRAISMRQGAIAEILLDYGADANKMSMAESPLTKAILLGSSDIVKMLLEKGADPNEDCSRGDRAGWAYALQICGEVIREPLINGLVCDFDHDLVLCTPTMCAIILGKVREVLTALRSQSVKDKFWYSLPDIFKQHVKRPVDRGDYEGKEDDEDGMTSKPFGAYEDGGEEIVKLLAAHDGDISKTGLNGCISLNPASNEQEHQNTAKFLVAGGRSRMKENVGDNDGHKQMISDVR
ncbi:hypothetical protein CkaCkLH20_08083 [Colletotrichum karsti]|uniref:NACHT domain-containing protein n=1 Tax=Colletotrichum karsti TaxID=1095194 RepID=A0A9P6I2C2_9PEZI|nr:uncharacterized protein CkaCkLH20_08083 [Colletotrichum karsti]KAF9874520.1 hypothetical protein CkaCkLH20_08083 [Colletotrichum karsti]